MEIVEDDGTFPVREVHRAAFGDHGPVVAELAGDLRRDPSTRSLVAVEDGTAVGNVMFTRNGWWTYGCSVRSGCSRGISGAGSAGS